MITAPDLHLACLAAVQEMPPFKEVELDGHIKRWGLQYEKHPDGNVFQVLCHWYDKNSKAGNTICNPDYVMFLPAEAVDLYRRVEDLVHTVLDQTVDK